MGAETTIWRHENKYICDSIELQLIEERIKYIMSKDRYVDDKGLYLVRSIYFDDYMKNSIKDNEDGNDPRSKWRIRSYNCSDNRISLEKKTKYKEMTNKLSCLIDRDCLDSILNGKRLKLFLGQNKLLDEFIVQKYEYLLEPVILSEYVRKPFIYSEGNVRVTFDCNISASNQYVNLFERNILKIPVLKTGYHILEVKWDDFLPDVIYHLIDCGHLKQSTFSKFYYGINTLKGNCYEF